MGLENVGADRIEPAFSVNWGMAARKKDANMASRELVKTAWAKYEESEGELPVPIDLGIGAIADAETPGRVWVPPTIRNLGKAMAMEDNSYAGSVGVEQYLRTQAEKTVFGPELWKKMGGSDTQKPYGLAWIQTSGGTGALHRHAEYLDAILDIENAIILLDPGWGNHKKIFGRFPTTTYDHQSPDGSYNFAGNIEAIEQMPDNSAVMFQVCGYNGDGLDRTHEQWDQLADLCADKRMHVVLDLAYNGLADGFGEDNYAVKAFVSRGLPVSICVSNSKNAGLYGGSRTGALYIANLGKDADRVQGYLANELARPSTSNPSTLGAKAVAHALETRSYYNEIGAARRFIDETRGHLAKAMSELMPANQLYSLTNGKGIFAKLPAWNNEQIGQLADKGVFVLPNGRINISGITEDTRERATSALVEAAQLRA